MHFYLALANEDGWGESLVHGKKTQWFDSKNAMFFAPGGVLCRYKACNTLNMRQNFKEVEVHTRSTFERKGHQNDDREEGDEGNMPSYVNQVFGFLSLSRNVQVVWQVLGRVGGEILEQTDLS